MELPWSVPWIELHTDERFLRTLTEGRWGLEDAEGELAIMVENETEQPVSDGTSYLILPEQGDSGSTVAVGNPKGLIDQIAELAALLREFARLCDPNKDKEHYDVNKALYRCVDQLSRCVSEHRRA